MSVLTKMIVNAALIAVVFSCLLLNTGAAGAQTGVRGTVERYMNALFAGNIDTLNQCLGKDFRQRHRNTFKDPTYSNYLINRYNGATFRIIRNQDRKDGKKIADVAITFKDSSTMTIRLLLNEGNQIIDEVLL
jgi:hypothetical protein